jgi:heavy metal sensor kinase
VTPLSVRGRLTVWFASVFGAVLLVLAAATWFMLRDSVGDTIDEELANRVAAISRFLNAPGASDSMEELREDLREYVALDPGWNLIRIRDHTGAQLYRSEAFDADAVDGPGGGTALAPGTYRDLTMRGLPVRLLSDHILVAGRTFSVDVAWPVGELQEAVANFGWAALLVIPCGMLAAALGGYVISRRALAPVDRLTNTARAITAQQLGRRLDVPPTGDELQRLAETLNEMLARLEAAFAETNRFTADASHELRTPISLIHTTAEVALRRTRTPEEYRQALQDVLDEAGRTSALVEDLLTLARGDAGVDGFALGPLDFSALVADIRGDVARACAGRGLEARFRIAAAPLPVAGDRSALVRLVRILADNAVKYTPSPGTVNLAVEALARPQPDAERHGGVWETREQVVLTISDTGIGIAPEDVPRVFDRFYRADKARSRDSGGAGLGLSIAKWIVDRHGGAITIDSEPGKGTRVRVTLPRRD